MIIPDEIRIARRERLQDNIRSKLFAQRTVKLLQLLNIARHMEHVSVKRAALSHLMTQQRFSHLKFLDKKTLYIKLIFFVLVVSGDFICCAACYRLHRDWCVKDILKFLTPQYEK
jgi:hypothetical protein